MTVTTRASASIQYIRRDIYVSSHPGESGGRLAEPIAVRMRNSTDEDTTGVRWYGDDVGWMPGELQAWIEEVTDFVMLLDDELAQALRKGRCEHLGTDPPPGLELLVLLTVNDARRQGGDRQGARLWLAKADSLRLDGLTKVAGKPEWNLKASDDQQLLHWLYEPTEKVLKNLANLVNNKILGDDETRLGQSIDRFVDHEPQRCLHCGQVHGAAAATDAT